MPLPWDESTRPHRPPPGEGVTYAEQGREVGQRLVDVHDMLRRELGELREVVAQVRSQHHGLEDDAVFPHLRRSDFEPLQEALDLLTAALTSHLSYEEEELVEPLARHGFYPGQV